MGEVPGARLVVFDPLNQESISKIFNSSINIEIQDIPAMYETFLREDAKSLENEIKNVLNDY
jgi:hypothetical protein